MKRDHFNWATDVEPRLPIFWSNVLRDAQLDPEWSRSMIFTVALCHASFASLHGAEVMQPKDQNCDLGLMMFVNGESGVAKSPVYHIFHRPIKDHCASDKVVHDATMQSFIPTKRSWDLRVKGLSKAIIKAVQTGEPDAQLLEAMIKLEYEKPETPVHDKMLIQAQSFSAFMQDAGGNHKRLFLAYHDANTILESGLMKHLDALCASWDYDSDFMLDNAFRQYCSSDLLFASLLMVQPIFFKPFIEKNDGAARSSGFLTRCLTVSVERNQERDPIGDEARNGEYLRRFLDLLKQLHDGASKRRAAGDYSRKVLIFSARATLLWKKHREYVRRESESESSGKYSDISDYMKKYMNNVSRIAGIFHIIEGQQDEISYDNLRGAIAVMRFYAAEFQAIFHPFDSVPKSVRDAWKVLKYLYRAHWNKKDNRVAYNDLVHARPVRDGVRHLDAAIDHLVLKGYLYDYKDRKKFLHLSVSAFHTLSAETFESPMPRHFCSRNKLPFEDSVKLDVEMPFLAGRRHQI